MRPATGSSRKVAAGTLVSVSRAEISRTFGFLLSFATGDQQVFRRRRRPLTRTDNGTMRAFTFRDDLFKDAMEKQKTKTKKTCTGDTRVMQRTNITRVCFRARRARLG